MEWLIFLGLGALLGSLFGWIAFFRTLSVSQEVASLRKEVARLREEATSGSTESVARAAARSEEKEYDGSAAASVAEPSSQWRSRLNEAQAVPDRSIQSSPEIVSPSAGAEEKGEEWGKWADQEAAFSTAAKEGTPGADVSEPHADHAWSSTQEQSLERGLAGNWLIWVGGATLALGGAFLLKSAIDAGFFGPCMRVATAIIAGFAMIAAGEWARRIRRLDEEKEEKGQGGWSHSVAPAVLAGAGGATIYGAIFAAYGIFNFLPAVAAFFLLAAACAGMVVLAVLHRAPAVAGLGFAGAYVSPLLTASGDSSPNALFLYIFAVSTAAFLVAQIMHWRAISIVGLAGGLIWPLVWLSAASASALGVYVYLPAFLLMTAALAWESAEKPIDANAVINSGAVSLPLPVGVFYTTTIVSLGLALLVSLKFETASAAPVMWGGMALITLGAASRREAFSVSPGLVMLATVLATFIAPQDGILRQLPISALFGATFLVGGVIAMRQQSEKGPVACVAAFGATFLLAVQFFHTGSSGDDHFLWAGLSFLLCLLNVGLLSWLRKTGESFGEHPAATSAFVLGATLASSLAVAMALDGLMMSAALAAQAPVLAWLWVNYRLPALKYAALALAALSSIRLLLLPEVIDYQFGVWPLFNMLLPGYLAPAIGFWFGARWFEKGGLDERARVVQALEGAAIALFAAFVTLQIRHLLNGGDIGSDRFSLLEASLQTINWVSISAFLRWRFGEHLTTTRRLAEVVLIGAGGMLSVYVALMSDNPWWGWDGPQIAGPPIFNMLLIAYLAPAIAFAAAAYAARRSGALQQSRMAGVFASLLGLMWAALSIRHLFHAPDLSAGDITLMEISLQIICWSLSAALLHDFFGAVKRPAFQLVERVLFSIAALTYFIFSLGFKNPWWGADGEYISGPPVMNALVVAYLLPAASFGYAAFAGMRSGNLKFSRTIGLFASFMGFVWCVMTVRHLFHAPVMSGGDISAGESWTYSIATIMYAIGLLVTAAYRQSRVLRIAGSGALMLACVKVFLFDTAGLDGAWRATTFLGLGAALIGVAMLYQRLSRDPAVSSDREN